MSDNQNKEPHKMPNIGLDESPLSAYAKAIRAVESKKSGHIFMGYVPPLLRVLTNINNLQTYTHYKDLRKDMLGKGRNAHFIPAKVMLQIPYACNNAVAILKSSVRATDNAFVFLTDLQERGMPLLVIFQYKMVGNNRYELSMPTAYGRDFATFQNLLNYDILCWDYSKAERFERLYSSVLDLPKHIYPTLDFGKQQRGVFSTETVLDSLSPLQMASQLLSHNTSPLFVDYDKTEAYLSQAFPDLSVNPNLYLDAEKVQKVREWTRENAPLTKKEAATQILSVCSAFAPDDSSSDKIKDSVATILDNRYQSNKGYITGKEVGQIKEKLTQKIQQVQQDTAKQDKGYLKR